MAKKGESRKPKTVVAHDEQPLSLPKKAAKKTPARKTTKTERYLFPGYEPAPRSTARDAMGTDCLQGLPGDVQRAVKSLAAALAEKLKDDAKRIEHRYPSSKPGRMNVRRVFKLEESDVDELATSAAVRGFALALEHYGSDLLKNESVRSAFGTAREKANAARLAAKIEKRNRITAHIEQAAAAGRSISVTQACKELGISVSTGHDAMNHHA